MSKPSLIVTNNVPLTSKQLDVYNFLLEEAQRQLFEDHEKNIFKINVNDIKRISPFLDSTKRVREFFEEIMDKKFQFNIIGKDKTVTSRVVSHLISGMKENDDKTFEVALEPFSIEAMKKMVKRKKGIKHKEFEILENGEKKEVEKDIELQPYLNAKLTEHADISFYPAKVIYELIKDYKGSLVPKISFNDFKIITQTVDKYKTSYKQNVIEKIEKIINKKDETLNLKIEIEKAGRINKSIIITSSINKIPETLETFVERFLAEAKMEKNEKNIKFATKFYRGGNYENNITN